MTSYAVWTPDMDELFLKTYGYPINIPSLFTGDSDYDKIIRMNYYRLVASLFKTSYTQQITAWCEANGTLSSGHMLFEENMNDQIETYGGDFMQLMGSMTVPGADVLWVNPDKLLSQTNIGNYMGLLYVSSAAKKAGIKVTTTGKVTVPKLCKKGTYTIAIKAAGNANFKAASKTVTIKIK
jgi:hypothetical protein